jgi:hypothetical protein
MRLEILDTINAPGQPGRGGDDRFGYDAAAGRAWVIDGATDVSDLKPFKRAESGAAWLADAASSRFQTGPEPGQAAHAYFAGVMRDLAAEAARQSSIPMAKLPLEARPIAAAIWMRIVRGGAEFVWAGDCLAFVETQGGPVRLVGSPEKADAETGEARRLLALSAEDRREALRTQRRTGNAPERGLITLDPAAAAHLSTVSVDLKPGTHILLMTDGLYRLVSPFGLETADSLFARVLKEGLSPAVEALRRHEAGEAGDRLKQSDDACAILLRTIA